MFGVSWDNSTQTVALTARSAPPLATGSAGVKGAAQLQGPSLTTEPLTIGTLCSRMTRQDVMLAVASTASAPALTVEMLDGRLDVGVSAAILAAVRLARATTFVFARIKPNSINAATNTNSTGIIRISSTTTTACRNGRSA